MSKVGSGGVGSDVTLVGRLGRAPTMLSRSTAEIREDESERLPFLSRRALKLSLLRLLTFGFRPDREAVGVTGGEEEEEEEEEEE